MRIMYLALDGNGEGGLSVCKLVERNTTLSSFVRKNKKNGEKKCRSCFAWAAIGYKIYKSYASTPLFYSRSSLGKKFAKLTHVSWV